MSAEKIKTNTQHSTPSPKWHDPRINEIWGGIQVSNTIKKQFNWRDILISNTIKKIFWPNCLKLETEKRNTNLPLGTCPFQKNSSKNLVTKIRQIIHQKNSSKNSSKKLVKIFAKKFIKKSVRKICQNSMSKNSSWNSS